MRRARLTAVLNARFVSRQYAQGVLERICVHNYKCLVDFELRLQETVLLLGSNGVGKTAVLDVMFGLRELLAGNVKVTDPIAFHPSTLTRWQPQNEQTIEIQAVVGGDRFHYRLAIEHTEGGKRSRIACEHLHGGDTPLFRCELGEVQLFRDNGSTGPTYQTDWTESALARVVPQESNQRLTSFMEAIRGMVVCTIRPALMRAESTREEVLLDRYASNFVDWYRHALQENPASTVAHVESLRPVMDGFNNVHLRQSGLDSRALMFDFEADGGSGRPGHSTLYKLRLDELSDGHRALVVLYALLHLKHDRGGVLLLDEPDNYLALAEIQPWLVALMDACGETLSQAVVCSHHPELIDYMGADCGVVLRRGPSADTSAEPLAASVSDYGLSLSEIVARGWE